MHPKVQEINTDILFACIRSIMNNKINYKLFEKYFACNEKNSKNMKQELFKRIVIPLYLPLISLIATMLVIMSKDSYRYNKFKLFLFCSGIITIIFSEISIRYSSINNLMTIIFFIVPLFLFLATYFILLNKLKYKTK